MQFNYFSLKMLRENFETAHAKLEALKSQLMSDALYIHQESFLEYYQQIASELAKFEKQLHACIKDNPNKYHLLINIPQKLWYDIFDPEFDYNTLKAADKKFDELNSNDLPKNTRQALIFLMIFWPNRTEAEYISILHRNKLEVDNNDIFYAASALGRLGLIKSISDPEKMPPDALIAMIDHDNYLAFRTACDAGNSDVLEWIKDQATTTQWTNMIASYNFTVFHHAYNNHDFKTMEWLITHCNKEEKVAMIESQNYGVFEKAFIQGDFTMMKWLAKQAKEERMKMIGMKNYKAFQLAASNGRLDILEWLVAPPASNDEKSKMLEANDYSAYRDAVKMGHMHVVQWLKSHSRPEQYKEMEKSKARQDFLNAYSVTDNTANMEQVFTQATPDQKADMLKVKDSPQNAFQNAIIDRNFKTIQWLFKHANADQKSDMIEMKGYRAFQIASSAGELGIMQFLFEYATPKQRVEMIAEDDFDAFQSAFSHNHVDAMEWLLKIPDCLAFAEKDVVKYGKIIINPFLEKAIISLHREYEAYIEKNKTKAGFDIQENQSESAYYMLRNFIRRNDRMLDKDIKFLLDIPSVRVLALKNSNELFSIANDKSNKEAISILLSIPSMRIDESKPTDLSSYAREPKTKGPYAVAKVLYAEEVKQLSEAIANYQSKITADNVIDILDTLRANLTARYMEHPEKINTLNGQIILPIDYAAFKELNLQGDDLKRAQEAYYRNSNHTALRYLSVPNDWLSPDATSIVVHDDNKQSANFAILQPLIAMLYLAAADATNPPSHTNFTVENRFDHFVQQLAAINRANNKEKNYDEPIITYDELAKTPHDDGEGDKPAAVALAKKLLLNTVIGHPMVTILTEEMLKHEIEFYVLQNITAKLGLQTLKELKTVMDKIDINSGGEKDIDIKSLEALGVTQKQMDSFLSELSEKYKDAFTSDMKAVVRDAFTINRNDHSFMKRCHALKLCRQEELNLRIEQAIAQQNQIKEAIDAKMKKWVSKNISDKLDTINLDKINHALDVFINDTGDKNEAIKQLHELDFDIKDLKKAYNKYAKQNTGGALVNELETIFNDSLVINQQMSCHVLKFCDLQALKAIVEDRLEKRPTIVVEDEERDRMSQSSPRVPVAPISPAQSKLNEEIRAWAIEEVLSRINTLNNRDIVMIADVLTQLENENNPYKAWLCLEKIGISEPGKIRFQMLKEKYGESYNVDENLKSLIDNAFSWVSSENGLSAYAYIPSNVTKQIDYIEKELIKDAPPEMHVDSDKENLVEQPDQARASGFKKESINTEIRRWAMEEVLSRVNTLSDSDIVTLYNLLERLDKEKSMDKALECLEVIGISEPGKIRFKILSEKHGDSFTKNNTLNNLIENAFAWTSSKNSASFNAYAYVPSNTVKLRAEIEATLKHEANSLKTMKSDAIFASNKAVFFKARTPSNQPKMTTINPDSSEQSKKQNKGH